MRLAHAVLLATAALSRAAAAGPADFRRATLDNGLTVLVQEDHRLPLVAVAIMYKAGARNEVPGQTGLAHYVEHMNFRASARFPGSENTESITRLGGRWNGYTWIDQTYYASTVPRESLGLALDIERDRMSASVFDPAEFAKERTSVIAELHSYDDPQSVLYDAVLAASFAAHPYRNNSIGWLSDVEQITRDEAYSFYRRYYHPNNAVLAIVGDVRADDAIAEARRRFADLPRGGESGEVRTVEPVQDGERRVTVRQPGPHAQVVMAWRAPALLDPDFPAMVLFDALLAGGKGFTFTRDYAAPEDAPLQRALVDAGLASSAGSDWQASRYPYVYTLQASVAAADGLAAAEAALRKAVDDAASREWSQAELQAAVRQVRAGWVSDLDDLAGRAHQLAFFEVSGRAELLASMPERVAAVTTHELRDFARSRLAREQATVGWFVPAQGRGVVGGVVGSVPGPLVAVPRTESLPQTVSPPVAFALPNGLRGHVVPGVGAGLVALRARIDLGTGADPARAALVIERLARPATGEPVGAALTFTLHDEPAAVTNLRWIEVSSHALGDDAPAMLALLAARLRAASLPVAPEEWDAVVDAARERARENAETAETALWARARAELHGAAARPAWSSADDLGRVTAEDARLAATAWVRPEHVQLVLAGGLDEAQARRAVTAALGGWTAAPSPRATAALAPAPIPRGPTTWTERVIAWPGKAQNEILVVWPGDRPAPADEAATEALLYLLGETGYAGRLGHALVDPGLAYSVYTTLEEVAGVPGFLAVRTAASQKDTPETLRRIREVLETAARGAFTQAELDEAKSYLRGRELRRRDGSEDTAEAVLEDATDPPRFDPQKLTLAQLNATARRLFARGAPVALVLGPGM